MSELCLVDCMLSALCFVHWGLARGAIKFEASLSSITEQYAKQKVIVT